MAVKCWKRAADTSLHDNGVPVCMECLDEMQNARKKTALERAYRLNPPSVPIAQLGAPNT
jgi:hypothetical protein